MNYCCIISNSMTFIRMADRRSNSCIIQFVESTNACGKMNNRRVGREEGEGQSWSQKESGGTEIEKSVEIGIFGWIYANFIKARSRNSLFITISNKWHQHINAFAFILFPISQPVPSIEHFESISWIPFVSTAFISFSFNSLHCVIHTILFLGAGYCMCEWVKCHINTVAIELARKLLFAYMLWINGLWVVSSECCSQQRALRTLSR